MNKISVLLILFVLLFTASCKKQLEKEPYKIHYDNFYQLPEDAESAINAVYDILGFVDMYNSNLWLIQDVASDDCNARPTLNDPNIKEFQNYNINSTNNYLAGTWQQSYLGISRANIVLFKVPDIDMDSARQSVILGEAKFLRSLFYFNLVRMFGDVPLLLKPVTSDLTQDELYVNRTAAHLVYEQVAEDLSEASETLPESYSKSGDKGRATKGAALGLLAKVQLTQGKWEAARDAAKSVMELNKYSLWPDYADNFKEVNANGAESVFEVQFFAPVTQENSRIVISGLPVLPAVFPAGVGIMQPTEDLLNSFEEGDYRKEVSFFDEYWFYTFEPHIWKHWDQDTYEPDEVGQSGANFPVMRYSEVLLIYAEAINEINGPDNDAYGAINQVRERARNGNPDVLPDIQGLGQAEFRTAVLNERRWEFVNEGQRWFDLVRTGNLIEFVKRAKGDNANPQFFNYVLPVPQRELDINKNLTQNPEY